MGASKMLRVPPDSELSHLLHDALASGSPVTVDTGDVIYKLGVEAALRAPAVDQRPTAEAAERSRSGIRQAAGSWADVDADAFKAYIRERRRTENRPPVKL
jgi:hypothetical protein